VSRIKRITLDHFTSFVELDQELSPGVNVLIGANGTGKTHLLKVLYAACAVTVGDDKEQGFARKLRNVFNPYEGRVGRLARRQSASAKTKVVVTREEGARLAVEFSAHTKRPEDIKVTGEDAWSRAELLSAYIPVKEMLAHAPGFLATATRREIAFEEVYVDIIQRALLPRLKGPAGAGRQRLLAALEGAMDGKVVAKGEHFFLRDKQGELEFTLLAEGLRKLALIWLLIQNGTLRSGAALFWDEPEANLNPSLMGEVVEVLLELQRIGAQVFLATHSYVLLKELDLRTRAGDQLRYLSLFRDDSGAVVASASESYLGVDPNAIAATFSDLYDRELTRSLGLKS